jgi:hypothetical protein
MSAARRALVCTVLALATLAAGSAAGAAPVLPDTAPIVLRTARNDAGPNPILQWKAARDAASYVVVVQTPKGRPYWTWRGTDTRVRLGGGGDGAVEDSEGASLQRRMVWFVVAFDADGTVIASSAKRPISP